MSAEHAAVDRLECVGASVARVGVPPAADSPLLPHVDHPADASPRL